MANMFSEYKKKGIPKTLRECYVTDSMTENLWIWCERLEKWGMILFWLIIVFGIVNAVFSSLVMKEVVVQEFYKEVTETRRVLDATLFITALLETALYAFLEYCSYHILALLVGSLASIVQHTKITANLSLYHAVNEEDDPEEILDNHTEQTWKCAHCGANNPQGSLGCKTCGEYR